MLIDVEANVGKGGGRGGRVREKMTGAIKEK